MNCMVCLVAPVIRRFQPVGRWYESRARHVRLLSCGSSGTGIVGSDSENEEDDRSGEDVNPLLLDPTQWKVTSQSRSPILCSLPLSLALPLSSIGSRSLCSIGTI